MTNAYVSLTDFKAAAVLNITGTGSDVRLRRLIEDVSRQVDRITKRHFYSLTRTRFMSARMSEEFARSERSLLPLPGDLRMVLPDDLIAVTSLKEDSNRDGSYNVTWAATDYELWPYDADPTSGDDWSRPYSIIEVNRRSNGNQDVFLSGQRIYELIGRWGYWERTEDTEADVNEAFSATDTTLTVTDGTKISVGETLLIESEQLYVTAVATNDLTVVRAVNGTTAATHASSTDISRFLYPGTIVEATIMQASRLWTRRASAFANQLGFTETGTIGPVMGMDEDVKQMLRPYVRKFI